MTKEDKIRIMFLACLKVAGDASLSPDNIKGKTASEIADKVSNLAYHIMIKSNGYLKKLS